MSNRHASGALQAQKSKEVTWSERDLAKHILRDKKKTPSAGLVLIMVWETLGSQVMTLQAF